MTSLIPMDASDHDVAAPPSSTGLDEPGHCAFARCTECSMPMAHAGVAGGLGARRCEMCEARESLRRC